MSILGLVNRWIQPDLSPAELCGDSASAPVLSGCSGVASRQIDSEPQHHHARKVSNTLYWSPTRISPMPLEKTSSRVPFLPFGPSSADPVDVFMRTPHGDGDLQAPDPFSQT